MHTNPRPKLANYISCWRGPRREVWVGRAGVISVDGHVKATRPGYRDYIDPTLREEYDGHVKVFEEAGMPDTGNCDPAWGIEVQWGSAARLAALEAKGVVAEVLFPNGVPF